MTINAKTAIPNQVDAQGMTVLKQQKHQKNISIKLAARQLFKRLVVCLAVRGFLPIAVAEWLIQHGGLAHA